MKCLKRLTACLLCLVLMTGLVACGKKKNNVVDPSEYHDLLSNVYYAQISIQDQGSIILQLDADVAPITVTNFVNLVNEGFYNGVTFHRIINGFMMQGGDPTGSGIGGSGTQIYGEFAANGYNNTISHLRGTISMARNKDYDSASSQFFIVQQDSTHLDGNYAAFGTVLAGMDVVDAICANTPVIDENGTVEADNQPKIDFIRMLTESEALEYYNAEHPLPDPTAQISATSVTNSKDVSATSHWSVDADGKHFVLSSTKDLFVLAIYKINWENGLVMDESTILASAINVLAGDTILVDLAISEEMPNILLVAKEHNGAIGKYLLSYSESVGGVYLVPIIE